MNTPRVICTAEHSFENAVEMRLEKIGVIVEMIRPNGPYFKVAADKYRCGECGATVLADFAKLPITEHYESEYGKTHSDVSARFA